MALLESSSLWVARHAPILAPGVCYGQCDLAPEKSARDVADELLTSFPADAPAVVWSSTLSRCREPAALLAERWNAELRVTPLLLELSFGSWENRLWDDLERASPSELSAWMSDYERVPPPGGETTGDLQRRVRQWFATEFHGPAALVGHAGVIRTLRVLLDAVSWQAALAQPVPHLEWARFVVQAGPVPGDISQRAP